MKIEVKVPAVGESITEAVIGSWSKKSGEYVKMNDVILLLETDKASVEVVAEKDGILSTLAKAGDTVKIGATIGSIDTDGKPASGIATATSTPVRRRKLVLLRRRAQEKGRLIGVISRQDGLSEP